MDKPIEQSVLLKKKRRKIAVIVTIVLALTASLVLLRGYIKPSIKRSSFTTAIAETGDIENTLDAMGEVLPEFEEVLVSPINAAVREVQMDAGMKIRSGQSILTLDKSAAQTEYEKLSFQIESKENEIRKLKLDLDKSFYDINSNNKIKELRISNFKDAVSSAQRLYKAGGGTREDIEAAELDLKVAILEKQQLENEIKSKQQTMKIEIREAEIALAIHRSDQLALKRKLDLANVTATRDGVITWVNKNIGASVSEGDPLARIANLSSYKVAGSISDAQLGSIRLNMPAIIRINQQQLRGIVSNISPSVKNAIVSFDVQLDEKNSKLLRPNMKVDVFLVTEKRNGVVRVANGAAFKGADSQYAFVLSNGRALRREIKTGMSNFDFIEIVSGINPGEEVINSDMEKFEYTGEITIQD
ncbi:efflux RND transporter periplasmic adaptor subunit [Pedobacter deserti]|uniref:efflux RND transporter periplasmic adaptor subunit n=1 Tax=Pedobacter deserti TaxID=2817382 RepID=UPI0021099EC6|nr:HlyD family efflux transporter periplasmic adaptor subunit [Pedobacter sp. SYSU D00382]